MPVPMTAPATSVVAATGPRPRWSPASVVADLSSGSLKSGPCVLVQPDDRSRPDRPVVAGAAHIEHGARAGRIGDRQVLQEDMVEARSEERRGGKEGRGGWWPERQ